MKENAMIFTDETMIIPDEIIRKAVDAYNAERCAAYGWSVAVAGMSETSKLAIAPMIAAAVRAALKELFPPPT